MRKFIITITFLLSTLLILTSCNGENPTKDDFRNIEFSLDVKHSNKITNREISIPDFKNIIKSYDKNQYWFGKGFSQDNSSENFAQYSNKIVIYSKELDEEVIKSIFKKAEVKVS